MEKLITSLISVLLNIFTSVNADDYVAILTTIVYLEDPRRIQNPAKTFKDSKNQLFLQ